MQTFLPIPSFKDSAQLLDYKRLGKQRVEAKQILQCLLGEGSLAWRNHPAVKMWKGCEQSLALYGITICQEWINRGYKDSLLPFFESKYNYELSAKQGKPNWLGNEEFHYSHASNLLRKDPNYYGQVFTDTPSDLPYVWPKGNE